jgi:DNA-binding HxlR family transcriptional regulator
MAEIGGRWDLAILTTLANTSSQRPSDLLQAINAQARDGRRLTWKVMGERLRHLEQAGYVCRSEMRPYPRERRYWVTPWTRSLLTQLAVLGTWYTEHAPGQAHLDNSAEMATPGRMR